MKFRHQPVDFLVGPGIEQYCIGELWEGGLHSGGLVDGTLSDPMAVVCWQNVQAPLEGLGVEKGDRKGADAATGTAEPAGNFAEEDGRCPRKPVIGFFMQWGEAGWTGIQKPV